MKNSRNRLTPFLIIILLILIWILVAVIVYKLINGKLKNIKRLKIDDDLVQELYSSIDDDDIILYSKGEYDINNLPADYIVSKASKYLSPEDIEFNNKQFVLSYESLDGAVKTAFGPDIKYNLEDINTNVNTYLQEDGKDLKLQMAYDKNNKNYIGTYSKINKKDNILIKKELVSATKTDTVNLRIDYFFYKKDKKYQICNNAKCDKIIKEVKDLDDYDYQDFAIVSFLKASDEVYYYNSNK